MNSVWSITEHPIQSNYEVILKDYCSGESTTITLYHGDLYNFTYMKDGEEVTKIGRFIIAELFKYSKKPGIDPNSNMLVDFSEVNAANIEKIYIDCITNIEIITKPDPEPRPRASIWMNATTSIENNTITLEDNTITTVTDHITGPIELILKDADNSGIGMYKARVIIEKDISIKDIIIPSYTSIAYRYNANDYIPHLTNLLAGYEYLITIEAGIVSFDMVSEEIFEPAYPINLISIGNGINETHLNKNKYTLQLIGSNTVNIGIPNLNDLVSYPSSVEEQGSGKWIALLIQTDTNLTDIQCRTSGQFNNLTQSDIDESKSIGATDDKTFVWWIKAETIGHTPLNLELIKNNTGIIQRVTINYNINYGV